MASQICLTKCVCGLASFSSPRQMLRHFQVLIRCIYNFCLYYCVMFRFAKTKQKIKKEARKTISFFIFEWIFLQENLVKLRTQEAIKKRNNPVTVLCHLELIAYIIFPNIAYLTILLSLQWQLLALCPWNILSLCGFSFFCTPIGAK